MTGRIWLDWPIITVSIFNTCLFLWLGLTVLLNANRRDWGVWLMGGGLLAGAIFFISHSAILGHELAQSFGNLNFWWRAGWFPVMLSPFVWYVAVLWFSGFWATPHSPLRRRHRVWLWLVVVWLAALLALLLIANPIPAYEQLVQAEIGRTLALRNVPLHFLLFPPWMLTCILLSIDVLLRSTEGDTPVVNSNTQLARQRSRPWLFGTAATLLVVSLVVTYFIGSVVASQPVANAGGLQAIRVETIAAYDLALSLAIALSLLMLGQAIVSYEIFTGRVLPRRSFVRHWRNAIILAAGFAILVGWSIATELRPIYTLLLATILLTLVSALYSWRSFREREQFVARLRPFVQSQGMSLTTPRATSAAVNLLTALCRDVLGTAHACLLPLGSMAPLVTTPLRYSVDIGVESNDVENNGAADRVAMQAPRDLNAGMTLLNDAAYAPYQWAISLWDERGRIGALLVGEKLDGGLYSQEEMEIAQAAGERILHVLANEEMVQRLIELQRTRSVAQRVMDLRTRRTLHDEVLPTLHLAVLQLSGADRQQPTVEHALHTLAEAHQQIAALLTDAQPMPARSPEPRELVSALRGLVEAEFVHNFEEICWHGLTPGQDGLYVNEMVAEIVLGAVREVIRNAASHGRGGNMDRPLRLEIALERHNLDSHNGAPGEMVLTIQDNGVGIHAHQCATSPTTKAGGGNGLALHSTLLAMVGGYLTVESPPTGGTVVRVAVAHSE